MENGWIIRVIFRGRCSWFWCTSGVHCHKREVVKESVGETKREWERENVRTASSFRCMQMGAARGVLARVVWRFNADWTTADSAAVRLPRLCVLRKSPQNSVHCRSRTNESRAQSGSFMYVLNHVHCVSLVFNSLDNFNCWKIYLMLEIKKLQWQLFLTFNIKKKLNCQIYIS